MPKTVKALKPLQVDRLTWRVLDKDGKKNKKGDAVPAYHAVGGVTGLLLQCRPPVSGNDVGARSWILRTIVGSKRRDIGLGGYPDVTLEIAREDARKAKGLIKQGIDPVAEKRAVKSALIASQAKAVTFRNVAAAYISKKSKEFKTSKQTQKLTSHLETYAYPHIGHMVVGDIERAHIVGLLKPIWETKTETATRVRAHVERILDMAGAEGLRTGDNPARWAGNLELSLAKPNKISKVQHYKALSLDDMPTFMAKLSTLEYMGARALHFAILTAARSGEIRGATWDEIDFTTNVWTIPAERMKGNRAHRVPLCASAVKLLESLPRDSEYIFHNTKGGPLSDVSISKSPKRLGYDVTAHGFRATFRTWAQEHTSYAEEVPELALAHVNSDRTRSAYARSELLDKRRDLMNDWESFCYNGLPEGDVVPMRHKA